MMIRDSVMTKAAILSIRPVSRALIPAFALCALGATSLRAQVGDQPNYESRASLEAEARSAESTNRMTEALLLRARLKSGDFQEGDRIVVKVESDSSAADTMQVRAGKVLQFPHMAELSLDGVLRSELNDKLRQHLGKYLKNPEVRATPLLPLAVLGSVRNPGFMYVPADYVLRDLIMRAGGPAPEADVGETIVRRSGKTIRDAQNVREAFTNGMSLDRLRLRAGDEVYVPAQQHRFQLSTILSIVSAAAAVSVAAIQLGNR